MPRAAREKSPESIYHIICRSVSEFSLFRDDEDKNYYLGLLKKYVDRERCKIYAYCLMDTHLHLHLDPQGADVSRFMHRVNTAYVRYYNKKYNRHGHVFQERFESSILFCDEYNLNVSAYIHNNSKDIAGYNGKEHLYPYSSYGIYLGIRKDTLGLVDTGFVLGLFNINDAEALLKRYAEFVQYMKDVGTGKTIKEYLAITTVNVYRSERKVLLRDCTPSKLLSYISEKLMVHLTASISLCSKHKLAGFRAFCAYAMRTLCGLSYREICENMHNISVSGCSRLCSRGYELLLENEKYRQVFDDLVHMVLV